MEGRTDHDVGAGNEMELANNTSEKHNGPYWTTDGAVVAKEVISNNAATDGQTDRSTGGFTSFYSLSSRNTSVANSVGNMSSLLENVHVPDDSDNGSIYSSGCSTIIGSIGRFNEGREARRPQRAKAHTAASVIPLAPPCSPVHLRSSLTGTPALVSSTGTAPGSGRRFQPPQGIQGLQAVLHSAMSEWDLDACALDSECTMADSSAVDVSVEEAWLEAWRTTRDSEGNRLTTGRASAVGSDRAPTKTPESYNQTDDGVDDFSECETESVATSLAVEVASLDDEGTYVGYGEDAAECDARQWCSDLDLDLEQEECGGYYLRDLPDQPLTSAGAGPGAPEDSAFWEESWSGPEGEGLSTYYRALDGEEAEEDWYCTGAGGAAEISTPQAPLRPPRTGTASSRTPTSDAGEAYHARSRPPFSTDQLTALGGGEAGATVRVTSEGWGRGPMPAVRQSKHQRTLVVAPGGGVGTGAGKAHSKQRVRRRRVGRDSSSGDSGGGPSSHSTESHQQETSHMAASTAQQQTNKRKRQDSDEHMDRMSTSGEEDEPAAPPEKRAAR